jgi:hypothetical protein
MHNRKNRGSFQKVLSMGNPMKRVVMENEQNMFLDGELMDECGYARDGISQ